MPRERTNNIGCTSERPWGRRRPLGVVLAGVLMLCAGEAMGQTPGAAGEGQPESIYEHRAIAEVIWLRGPDDDEPLGAPVPLDPALVQLAENQVRAKAGQAYDGASFASDIRRLMRRPEFGRITGDVQLREDGFVTLTIVVTTQPMILDVQVVGNRLISDQDIADVTVALIDTPIEPFRIDRFARNIEDLYRQKGYHLARVWAELDAIEETGTLIFVVREGERMRVTDIRFEGIDEELDFSPRELKPEIRTKIAGWFETGPLDQQALIDDTAALSQFYLDRGYLDVRVGTRTTPSLDGREVIVEFLISEGRRYTMRNVQVYYPDNVLPERYPTREAALAAATPDQGVTVVADLDGRPEYALYEYGVYTEEQISGFIDIKPGDLYSARKLRRVDQEIASRYGQMGWTYPMDAEANPPPIRHAEMRDEHEPLVDLFITIVEQDPSHDEARYRTGEISVLGNDHTSSPVILERTELRPDRPVDVTAIEKSQKRLRDSRLFAPGSIRFTIQDPDPIDIGYRDLLVEVKETNTGAVNLGGIVTSDAGLIGRLNITQRNFDIGDTPDSWGEFFAGRAFRGGGQTVSLDLLPGTEVATYAVSFSDPTFRGSKNSLSTSVSFRNRQFAEYDEQRYGARIGIGRRFGSRWNGSIGFRSEWVELSNIDDDQPVDMFEFAELSNLIGVSLDFVRTSVDNQFVATRGNRIAIHLEQVGRDYSFTKIHGEYALYIPLYEDFTGNSTVFSFRTSARYIPQSSDEVPIYERYYLGGQNFRGFDFRTVSPKGLNRAGEQTSDPVGGTWSYFAGVEVRQPVYKDTVSVVAFIDSGTVVNEVGFDDYRVSTGFGIRLAVPALSQVPLAFDFGFPIVSQDLDESRLFTFSIDLPFR